MPHLSIKEKKEVARRMILDGHTLAETAAAIAISINTVASWKRREGWEVTDGRGRINAVFAKRIETLVLMQNKSEADYIELEKLVSIASKFSPAVIPAAIANNDNTQSRKLPTLSELLPPPPTLDRPPRESGDGEEKQGKKRGRKKNSEANTLTADDVENLRQAFYSKLFDYQKEWHEAKKHDGRIILKSRQIGATFYFAHEALITALETGNNQIFVSASKRQAKQFRSYIVSFVEKTCGITLKGDPIKILLPDSEHGEVSLHFLGTQVSSVQGYSGDLYLDECAWVRGFSAIQEVASAMSLQARYKETYFSTPSSKGHDFYPFWTGDFYNKDRAKDQQISIDVSHSALKDGAVGGDGYWRQIVTIEDAMAKGCTLFNLDKVKRKYSPASYAMLCMCEFSSNENSVFKFNLLASSLVDALGYWKNFDPLADRPLGDSPCWLGYDPAGEGEDKAAVIVVAPPSSHSKKYRLVECIRMTDMDYVQQAAQVRRMCEKYNIVYMAIDKQGVGDGVFQTLRWEFPKSEGVRYTPESKASMVVKAQTLLSRGLLEVDNLFKDEFVPAMLAIEKSVTSSGMPTYYAKRSEGTGHADVAWAFLQAIDKAEFDNLTETDRVKNPKLCSEFI